VATVALGLLAALGWGVSDFLAGLATRRSPGLEVALVSQLASLGVLSAAAAVEGLQLDPSFALAAAAGGIATSIGTIALYKALAIGPMSVVATIAASGVAIPVVVGLASGERPGLPVAAGMALSVLGLVLVTRDGPLELESVSRKALALAFLAAVCLGVVYVALDRVAAASSAVTAAFWVRTTSVFALSLAVAAGPTRAADVVRGTWLAWASGVFEGSAILLFTSATAAGALSVVSVLGSLFPVFTIALAFALLGERMRALQAAGIVGVFAGVALITLGN
jgi:drug/metabolite transporter (DMT)-like permease